MNAVEDHDDYFVQKRNAAGTLGLSCLQKVVAAFRMIAYGVAADATDDYVRIGESTALESLRRFVRAVVHIFGHEYMRMPNEHDTTRLLAIGERRGFPYMLGSIDCMHWTWKNCPVAWQGMYVGHKKDPTIILEAVASKDLWIWHGFFGCQARIMISMFSKDLLFLQGLLKVRVHRLTIASMETIIQWVIISQMAYIHLGPLS